MDAEGQIEEETIAPERTRTPLEEAFFWTLGRARDLSFQTRLDEESLTSFLLSGVTVVTPLLIDLLGSGSEVGHECRWGPFNKAATANDPLSEAATGSDFVMVTAASEGNVRLAIFQAKKGVARMAIRQLFLIFVRNMLCVAANKPKRSGNTFASFSRPSHISNVHILHTWEVCWRKVVDVRLPMFDAKRRCLVSVDLGLLGG